MPNLTPPAVSRPLRDLSRTRPASARRPTACHACLRRIAIAESLGAAIVGHAAEAISPNYGDRPPNGQATESTHGRKSMSGECRHGSAIDRTRLSSSGHDFIDEPRLARSAGAPGRRRRGSRRDRQEHGEGAACGRGDGRPAGRRRAGAGRGDLRRRPATEARRLRQPHRAVRPAVRRQRVHERLPVLRVSPLEPRGRSAARSTRTRSARRSRPSSARGTSG